ncbi:MAG: NAD(P)H-hydrate dehydratase [Lachnospiraceae bacterium]|nr:NAD(P)H-hydrate dehydratase [Lachnospiraceae bacterium]
MEWIVDKAQMAAADRKTSEEMYVSEEALMERAALESFDILMEKGWISLEKADRMKILILAGPGNNGGDGLALGRILLEHGFAPRIWADGGTEGKSGLWLKQYQAFEALKGDGEGLIGALPEEPLDLVIDALFGISLNRPVAGSYADAIQRVQRLKELGAKVVSLDLPSGIHASTAQVMGHAVRADLTIAYAFLKLGNVLYPGADYNGELIRAGIGITEKALEGKPSACALAEQEISLPPRVAYSHKGTYGKVLVVAGSHGMAGAAFLSATAAFRCGCGMVRIHTHESNRIILQGSIPEATVTTYSDEDPLRGIREDLEWCDAVALGPGLSRSEAARSLVKHVITDSTRPVVADADALNILSEDLSPLLQGGTDIVITPHLGEMARLSGLSPEDIKGHLLETAMDFAKSYNVVCVLKDARTVIADPKGIPGINRNGNPGLATAGSGDVLTGMIASLIAQDTPLFMAAMLGTALHGRAGDLASAKHGAASVMARDIIEEIR